MNVNLSKFKSQIDKSNPLSFFKEVLNGKKYASFIENIYPQDGLGFTKLNNGNYSVYVNTGSYNEAGELIDNMEEYKGSIINDILEIFQFHILEIKNLLETRKRNHLFESKKADTKYVEVLISEVDSIISNLDFLKNQNEETIVLEILGEVRKVIDSYLTDNIIIPIRQKHLDYEPQYSYLLGETSNKEIEKLYEIMETLFLLDVERNSLETFKEVFSASSIVKIKEQIILESDKVLATAFFYALKRKYPNFKLQKIEASQAFYYINDKRELLKITQSALNTQHSRIHKEAEYLENYNKFLLLLNFGSV